MLVSSKGNPLICQDSKQTRTLTVENYCKWYSLFIVEEDNSVTEVSPEDMMTMINQGHQWYDHTYSPQFFKALASHLRVYPDEQSYEMVVGRWVLEGPESDETIAYLKHIGEI